MANALETYLASDLTKADVPTLVAMLRKVDAAVQRGGCGHRTMMAIDRLAREAKGESGVAPPAPETRKDQEHG